MCVYFFHPQTSLKKEEDEFMKHLYLLQTAEPRLIPITTWLLVCMMFLIHACVYF